MSEVAQLISEYGFPIVMMVGLGYFIYYIWNFISERIDPKIEEMHMQLIRVIDQVRMLDQDLIRLQEKVNVVLEYKGYVNLQILYCRSAPCILNRQTFLFTRSKW